MQVNIIGPFKNFSIKDTNLFLELEYGYKICNDQLLLEQKILKKDFTECIGSMGIDNLRKSVYVHHSFDLDSNKQYELNDVYHFLPMSWGHVQYFLLALWFVKDNSVNVEYFYLYEPQNGFVIRDKRNLWFSDSSGQYKPTTFTNEELQLALQWQSILFKCYKVDEMETLKVDRIDISQYQNHSSQIRYASMDRISRAIRFIVVGRGESFLPMKISAYVGALESLFSTTKTEVTHQVAERAVKILGGDIETRLKNYTLIKKLYGIRSLYVHGTEIKGTDLGKMIDLAKEFDGLMRGILKRVIKDYSILSDMKQNELDIWFRKLILQ